MSKRQVTVADFEDLLRDGLSSTKSYVILKQKHRSPVYLQFKPLIERRSPTIIYVGGKLSAFPDASDSKWQGRDSDERTSDLEAAFRKLPHDRVSEERVGSHAGEFIIAPSGQRRAFITKWNSPNFNVVGKLLSAIEDALKIEIENRAQVRKYLILVYTEALAGLFASEGGVKVEGRLVGKRSALQLGQEQYQSSSPAFAAFRSAYELDGFAAPASTPESA